MPLKKAHPLSTYVDLPNLSPLYVCRSGLNLLQRRDNENMHLLAITAKYMSAQSTSFRQVGILSLKHKRHSKQNGTLTNSTIYDWRFFLANSQTKSFLFLFVVLARFLPLPCRLNLFSNDNFHKLLKLLFVKFR